MTTEKRENIKGGVKLINTKQPHFFITQQIFPHKIFLIQIPNTGENNQDLYIHNNSTTIFYGVNRSKTQATIVSNSFN